LGGSYAEDTESSFYQKIPGGIDRRKAGGTQTASLTSPISLCFLTFSSSRRREVTAERKKVAEEKRRLEEAKAQVRIALFVVFSRFT
jgi:hypothetical protein